ncbi:transcription initiation factor TFIID subunit 1-like [Argiope bruennichi]|uniref:Transcription initiation factor TFIID subunit 1 like protein n=1 Tax=Argiope bruennichi TaxID=94029 RepID=A0A8T0ERP3_ARGBR|nr:transcription initiation factor TFIID subunit 1-like [Argiope bruennichi]KAF8778138.1 Transcription initiation factor TFIID subunit 1 like protein [Argiope bruennichi]
MEEDENTSSDGSVPNSPSAIDYYDINELCDDEEQNCSSNNTEQESKDFIKEIKLTFQEVSSVETHSDRPLASVLPEKYKDVDAKDYFSFFRDGTLRFLKLFGPGKPSSMPDIWRSVRKRAVENPIVQQQPVKELELEVESDEETHFMLYNEPAAGSSTNGSSFDSKINNSWRFGPAKLWYDMAEVPETAETYDYGLKLKDSSCAGEDGNKDDLPSDAYLMVTLQPWEDDVIWDGDEIKEKVMKDAYNPNKLAGWIPVSADRTMSAFREHCKIISSQSDNERFLQYTNRNLMKNDKKIVTQSIFPAENEKLLYDNWEDQIIWDSEAMNTISYPKPVENDPDIIVEIPDDKPPPPTSPELTKDRKDKKFRPMLKKPEEEEEEEDSCATVKDNFYNISNDEYYNPKITQETALKFGNNLLQHSIPSLELHSQLFPTNFSKEQLRRFHRPALKDFPYGLTSRSKFHGVQSLSRYIKEKELARQKESEAAGGGEMFFMRTLSDLSGRDGTLVLFEFSEEHPPLLSQVGMASRIKNYYRRKPGKDASMPDYKFGEIAYAHTSPFLGTLQPGQSLQAYENNLFRAPVYEHSVQETDFLIIRTRNRYYIREINAIFAVGQELPLVEVPAPKSEKANSFIRDFLMVYIYRLFLKSPDIPQRVRTEVVKAAFPMYKETSIRKRLSVCAIFNRTGCDSRYWVIKNDFRLPSEEEIRALVSPEQCCCFYSMLAAEQRLQDAGYGEKFQLMPEDETDSLQNKIADEVKAAPWNTSQAFLSAIKGKCLLELWGSADPTGCGEGFSYVKIPNKPQISKDDSNGQNPTKRLVKGTDADLRRLSLNNAKKLLKSFNVPDREIKNLTRWEIVDVVRTLSTQQAKMGEDGITKFARGNLNSQSEYIRRYKEECQRLFELQNKVLSSVEVLSSDEDASSEDESDLEEMGKHIESIISNKKSAKELSLENEEAERKELQKLMNSGVSKENQKEKPDLNNGKTYEGKILRIYRTYRNPATGVEYERTETVRKPDIMQMYLKIRETKDTAFIRNYSLDEAEKEEIRKEKRRIQDQLRRIKRNELKLQNVEPAKKKIKLESPANLKVKCGACGASGHMRTNKSCPLYASSPSLPPIAVAMTEEEEEEAVEKTAALDEPDLLKIDETKIIISTKVVKHDAELRKKSLILKIPKDAIGGSAKKRRTYDEPTSDYLSTPKVVNRKRVDPLVSINLLFEKILSELKNLPDTEPFWKPVSAKQAPNYYDIIDKPMDLFSMKEKVRKHLYRSREDFIVDLQQILDNSTLYNGKQSIFTLTAEKMLEHCFTLLATDEAKLMDLEKAINPLLDSPRVAFNFLLNTIVCDYLKAVPDSWPFHKPVDKRQVKGYYNLVEHPMDLETLIKNCKSNKYKTKLAFFSDVELIHTNSKVYNGETSQFTKTAQEIVNTCRASLELYAKELDRFELEIRGMDDNSPENSPKSTPSRKIKFVVKPQNHNGIIDNDIFVDVESFDTGAKSSSEKDYNFFMNSDINGESLKGFPIEESNSSFISSDFGLEYVSELKSHTASPSIPTNMQSLLPMNGISMIENTNDGLENMEPYFQTNCDTICDDLMLSSDTDEEMQTVNS